MPAVVGLALIRPTLEFPPAWLLRGPLHRARYSGPHVQSGSAVSGLLARGKFSKQVLQDMEVRKSKPGLRRPSGAQYP